MRRKTAPKDPVHPEVSRAAPSEVGLIAKKECAQSAMGEYVLDNLSHRTTQAQRPGPRGAFDCNQDAMAGFAAAHG
jgi:hypothetical protein